MTGASAAGPLVRRHADARDLRGMQAAVQGTWSLGSRWHVGDLAWGWHSVPGSERDRRTSLWARGDGTVVAWGWVELPGHLEMYVDPDLPGLAAEVLTWSDEVATGHERTVTVMDGDAATTAAVELAAYRRCDTAPFFVHHVIELDDALPPPQLPEGYRVRGLRPGEAAVRAEAHRAAWRPGRIGELMVPPVDLGPGESAMTVEAYRGVMGAWPYRRDLDQVVEAPDGRLAAFALGWLDAANDVGLLEPVGTVPGHARRGLASAASLAGLHAMRAAGATRAVVCPRGDDGYPAARIVYGRLGFRPVARTVTFAR